MLLQTQVDPDLRHRDCGGQVSDAHQIVGGAREGEYPVHFVYPAMSNLSHERYRLQPAEAFFDPFPLLLADGVTRVPRGAAINCAASASSQVLRYVRRHNVASVRALAKGLKRDYSNVHADVQALAAVGLLDATGAGVRADYDTIETKIAI